MEEKRTLLVGMDIGEQVTQISCFDFTTYEPVAIGRMIHGKREYEIPTALTYVPDRTDPFTALAFGCCKE